MTKLLLCTFVFAGIAAAQPLGLGVKAGVPLTDALTVGSPNPLDYIGNTNRYVIGAYGEIRLPGGFGAEVDALYRSFGFTSRRFNATAGNWEFPVLAKYRFGFGPLRPYIEGGVVLSHLTGIADLPEVNHRSNYGITLGAGVDVHLLFLHVSPELRYEGFAFQSFSTPTDVLHSNRNQALVLVGIGF